MVLVAKARVAVDVLRADASDSQADSDQVVVNIPDRTGLFGAARREVCRVEIEDQRAVVQEVCQRRFGTRIALQNEFGSS